MSTIPENKIELYEPVTALERPRRPEVFPPYEALESNEPRGADLRALWSVLRKRRWTIFSVVLVIFTLVLVATLKEKPVYRAVSMLEIEKENPNILTVQELFQLEGVSDTFLETQYKILQSDTLARRVARQLHLDHNSEFNRRGGFWPWGANKDGAFSTDPRHEDIVIRNFKDRLNIEPIRRSRLVQVSFDAEDPQLAAAVVNGLDSAYIDQNLENRWKATQKASEWLSQQLEGVKGKLEKSEDDLNRYAVANGLLYLESETGTQENIVDARLRELQEELTKAQSDRYSRESLYRLVQTGDYGSLPGVVDNKLMQDLTLRLSDLRTNYSQLSTTFSPTYPKLRQIQNEIDTTQGMLERERKRVADKITNDYQAALHREALIEQAFEAQQKQASQLAGQTVQYNILKREVDTNKQLYEGLLERLKEAGVSAGLKASNIRIVDRAIQPTRPVRPRVLLNLSLALVLGMAFAIGAAFLQEHLDNTIKTAEDIERFMRLPALAMIPSVESLNGHRGVPYGLPAPLKILEEATGDDAAKPAKFHRIDTVGRQYSTLSEAFRSLRTSVLLSSPERPPRSLLITSAQPSEGKTTISINLAVSLAQLGQRVLLVDCDMRKPSVHRGLGIEAEAGLAAYLTGQQDWSAVVVTTPIAGLSVIPCGPIPPNPAELLSCERMRSLLGEAMAQYSTVLLDSPPLLNVADSRVIAGQVEGVILVVKGNSTPRELGRRAQACARDVGANILGVVLNNVDLRSGDYYYRSYNYGYGDDQAGEKNG